MPIENDIGSIDIESLSIRANHPLQRTYRIEYSNNTSQFIHIYTLLNHSSTAYESRLWIDKPMLQMVGRSSYTITLTAQPLSDITALDDLPKTLSVMMLIDNSNWRATSIPIHYSSTNKTTSNSSTGRTRDATSANACRHCNEALTIRRYTCNTCLPAWNLCSKCVRIWGREAHIARCGDNHQFQVLPDTLSCSICKKEQNGDEAYVLCEACSENYPKRAIICMPCAGIHKNILDHMHDGGDDSYFADTNKRRHDFIRVNSTLHPIEDPKPYNIDSKSRITCHKCFSRIRLEFFRCTDCTEAFDLCDRCADNGGVAQHIFHDFVFLAPVVLESSPKMPQSSQYSSSVDS